MKHNLFRIRHTDLSDIDTVMQIYTFARHRMRQSGNIVQWQGGYPTRNIITSDIAAGNSYVIETDGNIKGVFTFIIGYDTSYALIEGEWPNDKPYGTIHRIAAAEGAKGIADAALEYCRRAGVNIRIDTHTANTPMLGWIAKIGFTYCGIIHVSDGTPRKAFHLEVENV